MINRDSLPEQVKSVLASFELEGCRISDELIEELITIQNGGDVFSVDKFKETTKQIIKKYKQKTDSDET